MTRQKPQRASRTPQRDRTAPSEVRSLFGIKVIAIPGFPEGSAALAAPGKELVFMVNIGKDL